jgi:hypothetical protein
VKCRHCGGAIHDDGHHHDDIEQCWIHDATGMHSCLGDSESDTMAEPETADPDSWLYA